jgi:hypothetical protein
MRLFQLVLLIGIVIITRFLCGSITPLSHLFMRSLAVLMKQREGAWDMLASRYSSVDGAHEYQFLFELFHLRQEFGQSINDFLAHMQFLWNQIDVFDPIWKDRTDAEMYVTRRNQHHLHQFLMALCDDFKPVRVQLSQCSPFPTLDTAIFELFHTENRSQTTCSQPSHTILAVPSSGDMQIRLHSQ